MVRTCRRFGSLLTGRHGSSWAASRARVAGGRGVGWFSLLAAAGWPPLPGRGGLEHRRAARVIAGARIAASRRREERSGRTAHVRWSGRLGQLWRNGDWFSPRLRNEAWQLLLSYVLDVFIEDVAW